MGFLGAKRFGNILKRKVQKSGKDEIYKNYRKSGGDNVTLRIPKNLQDDYVIYSGKKLTTTRKTSAEKSK